MQTCLSGAHASTEKANNNNTDKSVLYLMRAAVCSINLGPWT